MKKIIIFSLLLLPCVVFSQEATPKIKLDTASIKIKLDTASIKINAWQMQQIREFDRQLQELQKPIMQKEAEATKYIEGILSQVCDPKKTKWNIANGKIILTKE